MEYKEYLNNKTVVLVGSAPHMMMMKGNGKLIDSYDIIVRINYGYCDSVFNKYFGSRTDILYSSLHPIVFKKKLFSPKSDKICFFNKYKNNFKWICFITPRKLYKRNIRLELFKDIVKGKIPLEDIGVDWRIKLERKLGLITHGEGRESHIGLNSGMITICHLLKFNIKKLYITGINFYQEKSKIGSFYHDGYYRYIRHRKFTFFDRSTNPSLEFKYFKKLYKKDKRIKVDLILKRLLRKKE